MDDRRISSILADVQEAMVTAGKAFDEAVVEPMYRGGDVNDWELPNADWNIEIVFLKLLVACDALCLPSLRDQVLQTLAAARKHPQRFSAAEVGPDDPYAVWLAVARQSTNAIETIARPQSPHAVTKDVAEILRASAYSISDPKLFSAPPSDEDEVHLRIEGILKCVFPDLKHKPSLNKPIKNYQPDTGLPSIKTLIEYKFIADRKSIPTIADQIFADTRGYHSPEWDTFLYVIYETRRFQPERQWQILLESAGVPSNSQVIVISGEPLAPAPLPRVRKKAAPLPADPV
jgi:hypothetical protein